MNERIKLLLLEASKYALTMNPEEDSYGHPANLGKYHLDRDTKFAELIVKECMEVASPNYMSTPEDSAYYVELAIDRIADHFGVEE